MTAREAFEEWTYKHPATWPLGTVTINGKFHHYMDPDTDTAWLGFAAAWVACRERAASLATDFIDNRLYKPRFPACSYHAGELGEAIRKLGSPK